MYLVNLHGVLTCSNTSSDSVLSMVVHSSRVVDEVVVVVAVVLMVVVVVVEGETFSTLTLRTRRGWSLSAVLFRVIYIGDCSGDDERYRPDNFYCEFATQ